MNLARMRVTFMCEKPDTKQTQNTYRFIVIFNFQKKKKRKKNQVER